MQREHVGGNHAGCHVLETDRLAHDLHGAEREHERERNFNHHEYVPDSTVGPAARGMARRFLRYRVDVEPCGGKGGRETEEDCRGQADEEQEGERVPIQRYLVRARYARRDQRHEHVGAPSGNGHAGRASNKRQENALCQELSCQPHAVRTERGSSDHLTSPRRHPGQEQVRYVRASGRQHQPDGGKEHPKGSSHRTDNDLGQRDQANADTEIHGSMLLLESLRDDTKFCFGGPS